MITIIFMKIDILAFGAHPDDVELSCSGTLILHQQNGLKTGIVDLTKGEMGTRGSEQIRTEEAARAKQILGVTLRENLGFADGFILNDKPSRTAVAQKIRQYQPDIILCNAVSDRHPDHGHASKLVSDSVFLAGLSKFEIKGPDGSNLSAWKTPCIYHYIQDRYIKPDFVLDVSSVWEERMKAVMAYSSQFYNPNSSEPMTAISSKEFINFLSARAQEMGRQVNCPYAEGFTVERTVRVKLLTDLI